MDVGVCMANVMWMETSGKSEGKGQAKPAVIQLGGKSVDHC
jgi:hypothetical protein